MLFEQKSNIDTGGAPLSLPTNYESKVIAPRNPTLNRGPKIEPKFIPSTFLKEMSLDTQQKLLNTREMYLPKIIALSDMAQTSLQTTSKVDIDDPLFQPYPSDITFQKFEPFNSYEVPLLLRNNDKVARAVKVTQVDTPYFTILPPPNAFQKVAPGVALVFRIQFKPEEQRDYTHELLIATEREKFLIPIRAIGARAILDFPDDITFATTAVKSTNMSKVLFVRNIGNREARFVLQINKPFIVTPENGLLPVGESMQVTIDFHPTVNGEMKDELVIAYDTGEKVYVNVYGVAQDINVRLEKKSIHFENTYLDMINQRTVTLSNRSNQLVHFQWKQFAIEREEEQQKLRQLHALSEEEIDALHKLNVNTNESPSAGPFDFGVLIQRTFINHRRQLSSESYLFTHTNFRIDPIEGDIWPGGTLDIQVLFKPNEARKYEQTAWLDVVGREQRLPLILTGEGEGAKLESSFQILDIGCVYVGSTHLYEVVLANKGFIEARYKINKINSPFGSCFTFEPSSGIIPVDNYQAIQITFHSDQLGQFNEIFNVNIEGNPNVLPITISGQLIGPTFYFDQAQLKFGLVSYGFQTTLPCHLYNTSLVPMPFRLHIDQDQHKKSTVASFDEDEGEEEDRKINNEFQIRPSHGQLPPQSDMTIYVDFVPKAIQKYDTFLQVDINGVGKNIFSLPITAKSIVPRVTLHNDVIDLGRTFLNHPNERYVRLQNSTSLPMRYQFLYPRSGRLHFHSAEREGVIESNTTQDIPLTITVKQLGDIAEKVEIHRIGARDAPLELQVSATGTGPVLFIDPSELRFGTISVLDEHTQILSLSNESPIPAVFHCESEKKNSCFSCVPNSGIVEPHTSIDIRVIAKLNDRLKFNEDLIIYVEHSAPCTIPITALGTGALIVPDVPIFPSLNLGSRFVGTSIIQRIYFTNKGRRHLAVHFISASDTKSAYGIQRKTKANNKDTETNRLSDLTFRLEPERLEFAPDETRLLTLTGFASQPKIIDEAFTCLAIIGRSTGRDKLLSLKIHCEFVEPLMSFSKTDLYFRVEYNEQIIGDDPRTPISSELTFSNISAIDLTAQLRVKHPFLLKNDPNDELASTSRLDSTDETVTDILPNFTLTKTIKILTGASYSELVYFDPSANTKELSWKCDEQLVFTYEEHAFNDTIHLHGEVHYPNLLIEHTNLDFGCILNGSEVTRYLTMVNVSPLPVKYLWAFILDENEQNFTFEPQPQTNISSSQLNQTQIQSGPWSDNIDQQVTLATTTVTPKLEEIFDLSPFFGSLQPGETEKTSIRFYGHPGIKANVKAICQVENGPVYELSLHGQASYMAYRLNIHEVDFGDVHFDKSSTRTLTLTNVGSVPLDFHFLNLNDLNPPQQYAKLTIEPESGLCSPLTSTVLTIKFLPNIPERFEKIIYLQIAHFQPDEIRVIGTGMFSRLDIDLPRYIIENSIEEKFMEEIKDKTKENNRQHELDTLVVQSFVQKSNESHPQFLESTEQSNVSQQQQQSVRSSNVSLSTSTTSLSKRSLSSKSMPVLPDYLVDFEYIILGTVRQQTVHIKNPTNNNITFNIDRFAYKNTGFSFDCDRIKSLPPGETITITITFDPRGANLGLGPIECRVPIEVTSGPSLHLRLKANVTMPDLNASNDTLDFSTVKCGECKIATIQLRNPKEISCEWIAAYPGEDSNGKQIGRFPRRGNTSARRKPSTRIFEVLPPSGVILAGQKLNVQIKFTPAEETNYESRVLLRINQSSQRLMIICRGVGLEPQVIIGQMHGAIFEPTTSIVFNPILTHSHGDEQEIVIRNPCTFPVEIYNLEFDKQYLEEEKVLRLLPGYDENNNILLPTRPAGDKLPPEIQKFYEDVTKRADDDKNGDLTKRTDELSLPTDGVESNVGEVTSTTNQPLASVERSGDRITLNSTLDKPDLLVDKSETTLKRVADKIIDYDMTPVAQALARHLGIDLTSDGVQARNRRGIAIIVHGPPGSGKTMISRELSQLYDCSILNLDQIIIDAIDSSQRSEYAQRAYQTCRDATEKHNEEQRQAELDADHVAPLQTALHVKKTADKKKKSSSEATDSNAQIASMEPQPLTVPPQIKFKIHKHVTSTTNAELSQSQRNTEDSPYVDDDQEELMTYVLTEDIFVEILSARLQKADCIRGVIFDSLDTSFLANASQAAIAVLKAINNRSYIYAIITNFSYAKYKEAQARAEEIRRSEERLREQNDKEYVEEMDEDEYDALPAEEKQRIDQKRLQQKKERLLREQRIKEEKARLEHERQALKEAEPKKTKKGGSSQQLLGKGGAGSMAGGEKGLTAGSTATLGGGKAGSRLTLISARGPIGSDRSNAKLDGISAEDIEKKKASKSELKSTRDLSIREEGEGSNSLIKGSTTSDLDEEKEKKRDRELLVKFKTFEFYRNDLLNVFDLWDRTKGVTRSPPTPTNQSEEDHASGGLNTGGKKSTQKREKGKKIDTKDKEKVERTDDTGPTSTPSQQQLASTTPSNFDESTQLVKDETKKQSPTGTDEIINVPTIQIDTPVDYNSNQPLPSSVIDLVKSRLPTLDQILDGMGQGPHGPPVPKSFEFAVVPYPEPRTNPPCAEYGQYYFIATNENDPNLYADDSKLKENKTPEPPLNGEDADGKDTSQRGRRSRADRESGTTKRKTSGGPGGSSEGKSSQRGTTKGGSRGKQSPTHHSSDGQDGTSESSLEKPLPKIVRFRWIIPSQGEIRVRLRFVSNEVGQFDQTISFEILGTKRNYKIFCRGVCTFPTISREPRTVFPNRQKNRKPNEIVHKKFILSTEQYDFGPLVLGKDINKIRTGIYASNLETLTIDNTSPMDVEALFCFLNEVDPSKAIFFLEPTEMHLKPGESKLLKIMANPPREGHFEESLVCCIKENPEPIVYKLCCDGCTPDLQIEPTSFDFGQVLLYRKESRTIRLKNTKLIPVRWRLIGIGQDGIGQEFSTKTDTGIVEPMSTYELQLNYYASRPRSPASQRNKLILKLEISDTEGMPGAIKTQNIPVFVEPYDIVLDMTFQKGNDRGIDFGNVRVNQEAKQICTLKNKGKREIRYKFELLPDPKSKINASKYFEIVPKQGSLNAGGERNVPATNVTIIFKPTAELHLREAEIIVVSVINVAPGLKGTDSGSHSTHVGASHNTLKGNAEANAARNALATQQQTTVAPAEEEVARIRLKISAKATYSKFTLTPEKEVNFGPMPIGASRRVEKFLIENHGEHEFKFIITKYQRDTSPQKVNTKDAPSQGRLQIGPFIISPAFSMVLPGGNSTVSVECTSESDVPRKFEEEILIDIADKNPIDYPKGLVYKLKSELIVPQIDTSDISSIFEEHRIVRNLSSFKNIADSVTGGVYGEDERRFQFRNVIVGRTSKARFKISNSQKVPVDIILALRPTNKAHKIVEAFELDVHKTQIPPYSNHYAVISFTPTSMQSYSAIFDVNVDGQSKATRETRNIPNLSFELHGEGHLPRVTVLRPAIRNKKAQTMMIFNKLLLGRQATQQLLLVNDGVLPAKVDFYLHDVEGVYSLQTSTENAHPENLVINDATRKATAASAIFEVGQKITLDILFKPKPTQGSQRYDAVLRLVVVDNQYEDTTVQLIGESYTDDITLDNIHGLVMGDELLPIESGRQTIVDDDTIVSLSNTINFGEIHLNESRQILFSITNHHQKDSVRFEWPEHPQCTFSPRIGHLHAGCTKDIQIIFKTSKPIQLTKEKLLCSITKITFDRPVNEIPDWDDRMRSVKWIDVPQLPNDPTNPDQQRTNRPARKKVIEADIEPVHQRIEEQTRLLDIYISAVADYCRYKCSDFEIRYLETAMLQTRVHEVTITNRGKVSFNYAWQIHMEDSLRPFTPLIDRDLPTPEPIDSIRKGQKGGTRTPATNAPTPDSSNLQESPTVASGTRGKDKSTKETGKSTGKDGQTGSKTKGQRPSLKASATTENLAEEKEPETELNFLTDGTNITDMTRGDSDLSFQSPPTPLADVGYIPFMIEPDAGSIAVGANQIFKIKFAPLDVNDYQARLVCCIPNLETGKPGPVVAVRGRSLLPFCHFELEESDYLTSGRRRVDLLINNNSTNPPTTFIDRQTRVIEFKAVGTGSTLNRSFSVLNPTDNDYTYRWICDDNLDLTKQPSFVCRNIQGKIGSGSGSIMSFDFFPRSFGIVESMYHFEIPKHSLSVPFLLVGQINEPQILFDRTFISFHPVLIGHPIEETIILINKENRPFNYQFVERSFINGTTNNDLTIEPSSSGSISANTRLPLRVIFRPTQNRAYTYVLQCRIDETVELLNINVKGEGFANLSSVQCETIDGNRYDLTSVQTGTNEIRFDDVLIGNITSRQVEISNDGKYAFDYNWFSDNNQELGPFSVTPMKGTVTNSQKQTCQIIFEPRTREHRSLIQRLLHLNIVNGLKYDLLLIGQTTTPNINFSFLSYNFGSCFVYRAGMPENTCQLILTNQDTKDHTIECLYQSTAQLMIDFKAGLVASKQSNTCKLTFYPREQKIYRETIQFEIDGLTIINVIIEGEGVDFRVELAEPKYKIVNLGALHAGKSVTREVCLVNRSRAPISNCHITLLSSDSGAPRDMLTIQPTTPISLKARGGTATVTIKYTPRSRLPPFVEQILLKYGDLDVPMFAVRGCCQGYDIILDSDALPFGAVGKDCSLTRKLILSNRGDIGAAFAWNLAQLRDTPFSVSPTNGYIAPGQESTIEFVFQPHTIRHDIRCDRLECRLEGTKSVYVTLNGSCIEVASARETISISTAVRSKELSKSIVLKNNTNTLWTLTPVISGEYFSGPETVIIEPNSTKNYELTYLPLTEGKHTGTLFFPLPDGSGLLYNVNGNADSPRASGKFVREVPCKTPYIESLPIENWLKKSQRFRVTHEIIKQDRPEIATTIKYLEFIDVAPKSKRDFKLQFYSYKECVQQIKLIFKNEQTQEYMWYDITFKSIMDKRNAPTIANIELTTHVRQQTSHDIILDNPLPHKVTFQGQSAHPDILLPPEHVSIPASSQGSFNFTYMPLKAGKVETRLEINSSELGLYTYMLTLNALPARPERTLYFKAPLGSSQILSAKFTSYARTKTDYICKIDHPDFMVDRTVTAAPSSSPSTMEVGVDVTYEPSQLGDIRATLTVSSSSGSDYTFPLVGLGELPKPQGPFTVKSGGNTTITFKNVFAQALTYTFNVDNPLFHITKSQELIQARKSHRIVVSFDGSDTTNKADVMAKLIVSCPKTTGASNASSSSVQWIYYLKGITPS